MPAISRLRRSIALLAAIVLTATNAPASTEAAWQSLWSNRTRDAARAFAEAVERDGDDASAQRGLLLTHLLLGQDQLVGEALKRYGKITRGEPCDWYIDSVVDDFCGLESRNHYRALYEFAKRLSDKDDVPVVDRRSLLDRRAEYAFLRGDPGEAAKLARKLGRLVDWSILGPFDNASGSGHSRLQMDELDRSGKVHTGKFGQEIGWITPDEVAVTGVLVPTRYFYESEETTALLMTAFEIEDAGRYLLSISHQGDVEVTVDGQILFNGSRKIGGNEIAHFAVQLHAGEHRVAAKVSNRDRESAFGFAVSEMDGDPAEPRVRPVREWAAPAGEGVAAEQLRPAFETALAERAERAFAGEGDPEDVFWALRQAVRTAERDSVLELCRRIEEHYPDTAVLWAACGHVYHRYGENDDADRALERAAEFDGALVVPRLQSAQEDLGKKRYAAALATCQDVLAQAPRSVWALSLELQARLGQQDLEGVAERAQQLVSELPDQPIGYDFLSTWAERRGLKDDVQRYEREARERRPPLTQHYRKMLERAAQEDYSGVKKLLEELLKYAPDTAWIWSSLVESLLATSKYQDAMSTLDQALVSFPQDVSLLYYKAMFAEAGAYGPMSNARDHAAAIIQEALNFAPGNMTLRDKYRMLSDLTPYREFLPDPDLGTTLARRVDPTDYPGDRAVVLQESKRRLFFDSDISLVDYYVAVQLLTRAGVEAWERHPLSPAAGRVILEHKTVKSDGSEQEATLYGDAVHFENLEPGDIVVLHYQTTQFQGGRLKGHAWDQHHFGFTDPCLESRYELITRDRDSITLKAHNPTGPAGTISITEESLADGFSVVRWQIDDMPGFAQEDYATHVRSYLPWLDLTTVASWNEIANWYSDLASGQAEVTPVVRKKAQELCADASDPAEKVERIYRFVAQDINYVSVPFYMSAHIPREAEEVLDSRFGDCKDKSCLMIAMLAAVGIDDARFALIDAWGSRAVEGLPSPRFNHAIVCLPDGEGGHHWYDPTIKYGTSRQLPGSLAGGWALIAAPSTTELSRIPLPPVTEHPSTLQSAVTLGVDGSARVHRVSRFESVDETADQRVRLENLMAEQLREETLESIAVNHPGAVIESLDVFGRTDVDSMLVWEYVYTAPQLMQRSGSFLIGQVPWARRLSSQIGRIVAKATRRSPIDLHRLRSCRVESLTVALQEGTELVELPTAQDLSFGACRYVTAYEQVGDQLHARSELVLDGDRLLPEEFTDFKAFLEAVLQDQRRQLLMQQKG